MKIGNINFVLCHRIPERTFHIKGHYFPICARCTGFYIGAIILLIGFLIIGLGNVKAIILDANIILIALLIIVPTFIDGTTQLFGYRESNNPLRCISGIFGGIGLGVISTALKFSLVSIIPFLRFTLFFFG